MHGIYIGYIIDLNLCCTGVWLVFHLRLATPQVERKVKTHKCSWQTLWLHAEYTSYATVHTELVWPLLYFFSFFPFHLGCNTNFTLMTTINHPVKNIH